MKKRNGLLLGVTGVVLTAALCLGGCSTEEAASAGSAAEDVVNVNLDEDGAAPGTGKSEGTAASGDDGIKKEETSKDDASEAAQETDKTETVQVKAAADGSVKETTVEVVLKSQSGDSIEDVSNLQNIKNTKGEEEFVQTEDGRLLWDNLGESISYEGESKEALPVSVKITYYLDGKEIAPEDLAGKSGKVRIRFDYENLTERKVKIDGKNTEVKVPFLVMTAMALPEDVFSNIRVTNGKVLSVGGDPMMAGLAFPGLAESLKLEEWEGTEDVEIPAYVEVTADVQEFALEFTASVITPGIFADMDLEKLDDLDDLKESMEELEDASVELVDAAGELLDGVKEYKGYMQTYTTGVVSMDSGIKILEAGLGKLAENNAALTEGAKALEVGLVQLDDALQKADTSSSALADTGTMEELTACFTGLLTNAKLLGESLTSMSAEITKMENFASEVDAYQSSVGTITGEVREMLESAASGTVQDWSKTFHDDANRQAQANANAALEEALASTALDDAAKERIRNAFSLKGIDLTEKTQQLWDTEVANLQAVMEAAAAKLNELPVLSIPQISMDVSGVMTILEDMEKQLGTLGAYAENLSSMGEQVKELGVMLGKLKSAVSQLAQGSGQLRTGVEAYTKGVDQICAGVKELGSGSSSLASAGEALLEGADTLTEGMEAYEDGVRTFDEEGIQELSRLAGDDLQTLADRLRALQEADRAYDTFSGLAKGQTGSVRFLVETEEIK